MDNGSSLVYDPAMYNQLCFSYHIQRRHLRLVAMQFILYLLAIS